MSRVGIVVVSHSPALAQAALDLALAMVPSDPPAVAIAAGTADGCFGTDPMRVVEAIATADSGAGVVMLTDLGSAVLSAEMALEFSDPSHRAELVAAPFVEGLLAALVCAAGGAPLEQVAAAARDALGPKWAHLPPQVPPLGFNAEQGLASASIQVANAGGMHARPAAAIATLLAPFRAATTLRNAWGERADASSPIALGLLKAAAGDGLTVTAVGPDASLAVQAVTEAFAAGFGEEMVSPPVPLPSPGSGINPGLGVSPGQAWGPVRRIGAATREPQACPPLAEAERATAWVALEQARSRVVADLRARADTAAGQRGAILVALAAMADDPSLVQAARSAVLEEGLGAEQAWWRALSAAAASYRAAGGRTAERASDLIDLRDRVIQRLRGQESAAPDAHGAAIWLAEDLGPLELASLGAGACLGLVTERGGPTCHAAILARELGIPAVSGARGILALADGTRLWLDGSTGELVVDPCENLAPTTLPPPANPPANPPAKPPAKPPQSGVRFSAGATSDGVPIALLANVGGGHDNEAAAAWGAEGVGLLRTEFCFADGQQEPSVAEQSDRYAAILAAWPGKRVVIRSLDAGSDKPLAYLNADSEPNPALGLRGIRTARRRPEVLARQLEAIASAARRSEAEVWVMAPMISTAAEAGAFVEQARAAGLQRVGVMVETPAAVLCADSICSLVDFVSLGSNDLLQYTMAADRASAELAELSNPWQQALLRLIAMLGEAARRRGVPVGICGEAAAQAELAPVLVGLGISSLSMRPPALPAVAAALRSVSLSTAQAMAAAALQSNSPAEAARAALAVRKACNPGSVAGF